LRHLLRSGGASGAGLTFWSLGKRAVELPNEPDHLYESRPRGPLRRLWRAARQACRECRVRAQFLALRLTHRPGTFVFNGTSYPYFWHPCNTTWKNERAVELALILPALAAASQTGGKVLEVGNVLGLYGASGHVVVDKYDKSPGVRNDDIADFNPPEGGFDLIVSVSTLEHVGWNEEPRQPQKVWLALERLKTTCLAPGGRLMVTIPLGFNPEVDRAVREGAALFQEQFYLRRASAGNAWVQCDRRDVAGARYAFPYPWANALLIGIHARPR